MNQVTETLRLEPGATESDAVARLSTLFEIMSRAKGFREAEILRSTLNPGQLLVLHSWDTMEDWTTFQTSETKMSFTASRPAFLYTFLPCGMNWLLKSAKGRSREGAFLRREVLRQPLEPSSGPEVAYSQTFAYQDYETWLAGAMLRLTRLDTAPTDVHAAGETVIADEVFEPVLRHAAVSEEAKVAG